jgi:tetratricopeptide (TPR) repeat protein
MISIRTFAIALLLIASFPARAYWTAQDLSETEWQAWPDYCKAAYLNTDWSQQSPFLGRLSRDQITSILRTTTIDGAHHFCIGLIAIGRTRGKTPSVVKPLMKTAVSEINYSRSRMPLTNPQFSFVSAYYAKAMYGTGERAKAFQIWDECIERTPKIREPYLLKAEALVSEKKFDEALLVLQAFDANKAEQFPDAEYFLGYVYFNLKKYPEARRHLDAADKLGYPAEGLRNRLTKLGY